MWPFDRTTKHRVLRVCRNAIELRKRTPGGLALERREVLATAMHLQALEDAVARLFATHEEVGAMRVHVVLESCWLPIMALRPSTRQRDVAALVALLRERLAHLHDSAEDPVGRWTLQVDGLPGDDLVLGYGLPARVHDSVTRSLRGAKVQALSVQPAVAWARAHDSQGLARRHSGSWFWQESDRTIVMGLVRGRCTSLHPAAPPLHDGLDVVAIAASEAARAGVSPGDVVLVGGWREPRLSGQGVRWLGIAPSQPVASAGSDNSLAMPMAQESL